MPRVLFAALVALVVLTLPPDLPGGPRPALAQAKTPCLVGVAFDANDNYASVDYDNTKCLPKCASPKVCTGLVHHFTVDCTRAGNSGCPWCWFLDIYRWNIITQDYELVLSQQMTTQQTAACTTSPQVHAVYKVCLDAGYAFKAVYSVYDDCTGTTLLKDQTVEFAI